MPRRREVPKRKILPESKYGDETLAKFMNNLMMRGKKSVAERIVYDALDLLKAKSNEEDALAVFKKAIENVKPMVEVKSRRVGGSTYQVPVEIRGSRRTALGMRWIINFARNRGERTMAEKLAAELYDASQGRAQLSQKA